MTKRALIAGWLVFWFASLAAGAQNEGWSLELGAERADVSIGERSVVWGTDRLQLSYRDPARGGAFFGFERQQRDGQVDAVFLGGAYRRLGDWTLFGQAGGTPSADFYFRAMAEAEVSRRLAGTVVAHLSYRYLRFPAARVQVFSPAATYYFSRGEIHGRLFQVHNRALGVDSRAFLIRAIWQWTPRLRLAGGAAFGERIFDVTSLASEPAEGWLTFLDARFQWTEASALGVQIGLAHEEPSFERRSLGLYYRRSF